MILVTTIFGGGKTVRAATYLPIPDEDLARNAPIIVLAEAVESRTRLDDGTSDPLPQTVTAFQVLEVLKGTMPASTFRLVLPGGSAGDQNLWIPGRPEFAPGQRSVLFVFPLEGRYDEYGLTEFALSVFDVMRDRTGTLFAVRTQFQAGEETVLSLDGAPAVPDHIRPFASFVAALRVAGTGRPLPAIAPAAPDGPLVPASAGREALWGNIGGVENGTNNLFRWFWDTGNSQNAVVVPSGTQTNLTDGSNGLSYVQNTATQWSGVSGASVHIGYSTTPPGSGAITVNLDSSSASGGWSTPMDCGLGVIGLGGPGSASGPYSFKGDSPYYAVQYGTVWMRKSICSSGYSHLIFRSAVLHEVGHTLGLGHPDQVQSIHSTTTSTDWSNAVMHSVIPSGMPSTPQTDDIAAIRYYYGTGTPPPGAAFTFSPSSPLVSQTVQFTDTSTGSPTSWSWNFGDSGTSTLQNPTHAYAAAGPYTVTLTATNAGGPSPISHTVTVSSTGPRPTASFTFSPSSPVVSQIVQFTDTSTNSPTSWSWNFGDYGTSNARNPMHAWSYPGNYTVTLTAANANGSNQTTRLVTVSPSGSAPVANFGLSPENPAVNQTVQFTDASTGSPTSWSWNFGDLGTSNLQNPAHAYAVAGTYTVTLTATNANGSTGTTRSVTVASFVACVEDANTLCLIGGRYQVTARWKDQYAGGATANMFKVTLTDATGAFWLLNSSTYEFMIRVNTATNNGRAWIAIPTFTDVEFWIDVTDEKTGEFKEYHSAPGNQTLLYDPYFFTYPVLTQDPAGPPPPSAVSAAIPEPAAGVERSSAATVCVEDANTMCLIGGRYQVTARWKNQYAGGATANMFKAKLTDATGAFWLLNSSTYEFMIRVETATNNGRAWIAIPTFTDVEFWIDVLDTQTSQSKEYHSAPGNETLTYDPYFFVYP